MPFQLEQDRVVELWDQGESERAILRRRRNYYNGDHDILNDTSTMADGRSKNKAVTNWIRYIVDKHVGFITAKPFEVTFSSETDDSVSIRYEALAKRNALDAVDMEIVKYAILYGWAVEVHSYGDEGIEITPYLPLDWRIVYDDDGNVKAAIHKAVLPEGSVYGEELLPEDRVIYTVYDEVRTMVYQETHLETTDVNTKEKKTTTVLVELDNRPNPYGRIPVVVYMCSDDGRSFITDALITQQDGYNKARSSNSDDVEYNADSLLKITGMDPEAVYEKDDTGATYYQKMKTDKILVLPGDKADANFLNRGNDFDKVEFDLSTYRRDLHMMGRVCDVESMVGTTGATSGIALKLKLTPQIDQADAFVKRIKMGLVDRMALINQVWEYKSQPRAIDFDVKVYTDIPVNETEIWEALPNIEAYLPRLELVKLIPSVENPEAVVEAKKQEEEESDSRTMEAFMERNIEPPDSGPGPGVTDPQPPEPGPSGPEPV